MKLDNKKGIVLVAALSMMLIFFALGTSYLVSTREEAQTGSSDFDYLLALYRAEAGVEHMIAKLKVDGLNNDNWTEYKPDGMGPADYYASYTASDQTIRSDGSNGDNSYFLRVEAEIDQKRFTGALQSGGNILTGGSLTGTITGDIDAAGTIPDPLGSFTINGNKTAASSVTIPAVDFSGYLNDSDHRYETLNSYTWSAGPPNGDGMYYYNGNLTISGTCILNGTIVVTGLLTITTMSWDQLQITPTGNNPALVAGNIDISSVQRPVISGLIFANGYLRLQTSDQMSINGGVVCGGDLTLDSLTTLNLTYDDTMDPPYFTGGGGGIEVTSWKGPVN